MLLSRMFLRFQTQPPSTMPAGDADPVADADTYIDMESGNSQPELEPLLPPAQAVGHMRGCDAAWRAYNHVCLQTAMYSTAILGSGAATLGSLLGLAHWADTHGRSMDFVEDHAIGMVLLAITSATVATAAGIAAAGHARLQGGQPLYYRLAPASDLGAGHVVRASGIAALACTAGAATALVGASL